MKISMQFSENIEIIPLSNESAGVRGFSFLIITPGLSLLIDPSVSLGPRRYGLVPHPFEIVTSYLFRKQITRLAKNTNILIITHYHGDHYTIPWRRALEFTDNNVFQKTYFQTEVGDKKTAIIKIDNNEKTISFKKVIMAISPEYVTWNQKKRAYKLWNNQQNKGVYLFNAEKKTIENEEIIISFSNPFPHGADKKRGNIIMTKITDKIEEKTVIFSSDVEGLIHQKTLEYLKSQQIDLIFLDGYGYYHPKAKENEVALFVNNLNELADSINDIVLAHHFNRGQERELFFKDHGIKKYPSVMEKIAGISWYLESIRKELWEQFKVTDENIDPKKPYYVSFEVEDFIENCFKEFQALNQYFSKLQKIQLT